MNHHTRRNALRTISAGLGSLPLMNTFPASLAAAANSNAGNARPGHHEPKAKRVIFIFLNGGLSHVDSFDHKPQLTKDAWKTVSFHEWQGKADNYTFFLKPPQWTFRPGGQSGLMISDLFPHLRDVADDLCVLNSLCSDHTNHYEASLGMHTGSFTFSRPSMGAWVSYGLGSDNPHLPPFVVLSPGLPYAGTQAFGSDFLPGNHQGTHITPGATPIADLSPQYDLERQQQEIEFIRQMNQRQLQGRPEAAALAARSQAFDTAFGMQQVAPRVFDLAEETQSTLDMYGLNRGQTDGFAWQCLVARRFAEQGVRFIELISSNWDQHGDMMGHAPLAQAVDQPVAALITDLKQRGMLEDTLVVLTSEFGRTPHHLTKDAKGREHHHQVFSTVLAGGGIKAGHVHGTSDDYGLEPAEDRLHLLGLDHERLTYRHAGRDYRLTDVHGHVATDIIT
jgi:hypothetical protein